MSATSDDEVSETTTFKIKPISVNNPLSINDSLSLNEPTTNSPYQDFTQSNLNFTKQSLKFELDSDIQFNDEKVKTSIIEIKKQINEVASSVLFEWTDVPVILPEPITDLNLQRNNQNNLFKIPNTYELDELAFDSNGKRKRLNKKQLDSIKRKGEFEVESKNLPGLTHRWVLAKWFQKGYERANSTFYANLATALSLLVVTAKRRFASKCFSFLAGILRWKKLFIDFIDIFIGLPHMTTVGYDEKLERDLDEFLIAELKVDPSQLNLLMSFSEIVESFKKNQKKDLPNTFIHTPFLFTTPQNTVIDLRVYSSKTMKEINSILSQLLQKDQNERLALNKIKNESIIKYQKENLNDNEISERTQKDLDTENLALIGKKLLNNNKLEEISPGIGRILWNHLRTVMIMNEAQKEYDKRLKNHLEEYEKNLKMNYKIRSNIKAWMDEQISNEQEKFKKANLYSIYESSLNQLKKENLIQAAYFAEREHLFLTEKLQSLKEKYEKIKEPTKTFTFRRMIWLPKNYKIEKYIGYDNKTHYNLIRSTEYKNTTRYPFWRWGNFFIRLFVNFSNVFYLFGLVIPFASPVSFRALFAISPFCVHYSVNEAGALKKDTSPTTRTFISRLSAIWRHVRISRRKFETIPDRGLIGKSIQRIFNRIWNYLFKGFIGSVCLTLIFPPVCILASVGSLFLCVTSPIWFPMLNIFEHIGFLFIYDIDYIGYRKRYRLFRLIRLVIWDMFICGVLQPIGALVTAMFACPVASLSVTLFAVVRKIRRAVSDNIFFHTIIRCKARVPANDSFIARRVAGPGLASDYFYQINPEQALAALEAQIEVNLLNTYRAYIENIIKEPTRLYREFFDCMFKSYSYNMSSESLKYQAIQNRCDKFISKYDNLINKRLDALTNLINNGNLNQVRLSEKHLQIVLSEGTKIVQKHYEESIFKYMNKSKKNFFIDKQLDEDNWQKITEEILQSLFGNGILEPLETTDHYFKLEIDHLNLSKYARMIERSELRDDLDMAHSVYTPKLNNLNINMDKIPTDCLYQPTSNSKQRATELWMSESLEPNSKLTVPTYIPDQYVLAILVHNSMFPFKKIELEPSANISYSIQTHNDILFHKKNTG